MVLMNSATILNQGLKLMKQCTDPTVAADVTTETYVELIKELIKTISDERKPEIREKICEALYEDSDSEEGDIFQSLPVKRKRGGLRPTLSITEAFNNIPKSPLVSMNDKMRSEAVSKSGMQTSTSTIAATPSVVDIGSATKSNSTYHGARRLSWTRLMSEK